MKGEKKCIGPERTEKTSEEREKERDEREEGAVRNGEKDVRDARIFL